MGVSEINRGLKRCRFSYSRLKGMAGRSAKSEQHHLSYAVQLPPIKTQALWDKSSSEKTGRTSHLDVILLMEVPSCNGSPECANTPGRRYCKVSLNASICRRYRQIGVVHIAMQFPLTVFLFPKHNVFAIVYDRLVFGADGVGPLFH